VHTLQQQNAAAKTAIKHLQITTHILLKIEIHNINYVMHYVLKSAPCVFRIIQSKIS